MNIPYLIKTLETNKLSELVAVIDAPPIDFNLAIWDSVAAGEILVDEDKDRVKVIMDVVPMWHDPELANKLVRTVQKYAANQLTINRGRLDAQVKEPLTGIGYPRHEYIMTLQYLVDSGTLTEDIVSVPKTKSRPYHKFVFFGLPENKEQNPEWNARQVNNWLENWKKSKVQ